jgi:ribose 5-phosphate isomerase A
MDASRADIEGLKQAAAERALQLVHPGMVLGLGTGTTARYFIEGLARKVREGLVVQGVVTSIESRRLAEAGGIQLTDHLERSLDLAVDGADEIDPQLNCIKGRGGALLREKIVAHASRRFVLIADDSKLVGRLGGIPVPIEVLPFLWEATSRSIESLGGRPQLRTTPAGPFTTDNGNLIFDTSFERVDAGLATTVKAIPGVIEHGLFFGLARAAIVGTSSGVKVLGEPE